MKHNSLVTLIDFENLQQSECMETVIFTNTVIMKFYPHNSNRLRTCLLQIAGVS